MALRYRQAVVIPGSSLWIGDVALACKITHSEYGHLLSKKIYVMCDLFLQKAMKQLSPSGMFFFECSVGGKIDEVMPMIIKQCALLQDRAEAAGLVAPGEFPVFEYGTLCLLHKDFCQSGVVRQGVEYNGYQSSQWGPQNQNYWFLLDAAADTMAAVCKQTNTCVGGHGPAYGLLGQHLERYVALTKDVSAASGAGGIVSEGLGGG